VLEVRLRDELIERVLRCRRTVFGPGTTDVPLRGGHRFVTEQLHQRVDADVGVGQLGGKRCAVAHGLVHRGRAGHRAVGRRFVPPGKRTARESRYVSRTSIRFCSIGIRRSLPPLPRTWITPPSSVVRMSPTLARSSSSARSPARSHTRGQHAAPRWPQMAGVASRRLPTPPPRTLAGVARDNEYGEIEYGGLPVVSSCRARQPAPRHTDLVCLGALAVVGFGDSLQGDAMTVLRQLLNRERTPRGVSCS
jgi:hypothetical protein